MKPRIDGNGAAWAVAHRIAKVIWLVLHDGVAYQEKGPAPVDPRKLLRKFRRLTRELGLQGYDVRALLDEGITVQA